jgi:hypothetical protein
MARRGGHNRGIVSKNGKWWARVYVNGRENRYRAETKARRRQSMREYRPRKGKCGFSLSNSIASSKSLYALGFNVVWRE